MLQQTRPQDYFVIFIASHGYMSPKVNPNGKTEELPVYVLYDTDLENTDNTAIKMTSIRELVDKIPAKKGMVITDTCHSGGILLENKRAIKPVERANNKYIDEMKNIEKGVGFISAADQQESAEEQPGFNNGIFTHYLLQGLSGLADEVDTETRQKDGKVTFSELKKYVAKEVSRQTNGRQNPQGFMTAYEGNNIPLAYVNYAKSAGIGDSHGALNLRVSDFDGVEVAINGEKTLTLERTIARTVNLTPGRYKVTFTKDNASATQEVEVKAGDMKEVDINLSFTKSNEDSLTLEDDDKIEVFLKEEKQPNKEAQSLFCKGVDSFNKQQYPAAIDLFNQAIQVNGGGYTDAFCYKGQAETAAAKYPEAIKSFTEALALRPSDYETKTLLASAKSLAGFGLEEIKKDLLEIIQRHSKISFPRVVLGDVLLSSENSNNLRLAKTHLKQAISANPNDPAARMVLANVLMNIDFLPDQKEAIVQAQKALELWDQVSQKQKSNAKAIRNLSISHLLFGGGRFENAQAIAETKYLLAKANILFCETLITKIADPNAKAAERDILEEFSNSGDISIYTKSSRSNIQEAIKLAQNFPDKTRLALALDVSARTYYLEENVDKAIADAELALKTCANLRKLKNFAEPHFTLYSAYFAKQQYATAADHLQQYISLYGTFMSQDQKQALLEELEDVKRQSGANRKKK